MPEKAIIRAGMGGWTFEPWEGTFYPSGLPRKGQLEFAARRVPTIEINGTYYRNQKPATFASWAAQVPPGFMFSVKANRFATIKKVLAESGESIARFVNSGIVELGPSLGPLLWQFAPTKRFDADDFAAWLKLLPQRHGGVALRHVVEVRHASFLTPEFVDMAAQARIAICFADHQTYPGLADVTADFVYARLQQGDDAIPTAYSPGDLAVWGQRAKRWAEGGEPEDLPRAAPERKPGKQPRDVFVYFIHEGKIRAPQAAIAFMEAVAG